MGIETTIRNGRINVAAPPGLSDGTKVILDITPITEKIGLDEAESGDDADALAEWDAWLKTIEPIDWAT